MSSVCRVYGWRMSNVYSKRSHTAINFKQKIWYLCITQRTLTYVSVNSERTQRMPNVHLPYISVSERMQGYARIL